MRILQVVVRFFPYVGGVENTVYHLARRFKARGHEVRVVCADEPEGSPSEVEGIQVVRLPWRFKVGNTNLAFGLWEALRAEKADVIHAHLPTAFFIDMAAAVAEASGVPMVLTYNNDLVGDGIKGMLADVYNRHRLPKVFAASDRIVITNPLYPSQSPFLDPADPKLVYIPWGVDEKRFEPRDFPPGPMTVGFLSLLDEHHRYKGLEVLLKALAEVPDVRLRVGGAGQELDWYRERARDLGDRVEFLGFVEDLNAFYASCHVFALPSTDGRREGFGLVLLEAMACGRPVITTPIVGIASDVEPRGVGVLVPPNDPGALAAALSRLLETVPPNVETPRGASPRRGEQFHLPRSTPRGAWNGGADVAAAETPHGASLHWGGKPTDLPAMGRRARQLVEERYTWDRVTDSYEQLFESLLENP